MPWTRDKRLRYQAAWRARNPTYQQQLKKYRRTVEGQWKQDFEERTRPSRVSSGDSTEVGRKKTRPGTVNSSHGATVRYPWEDQ